MACGACGHTMQGLTTGGAVAWYWCPRCGSLKQKIGDDGFEQTEAPKLVDRCRRFHEHHIPLTGSHDDAWYRIGVAEAIYPPGERDK